MGADLVFLWLFLLLSYGYLLGMWRCSSPGRVSWRRSREDLSVTGVREPDVEGDLEEEVEVVEAGAGLRRPSVSSASS